MHGLNGIHNQIQDDLLQLNSVTSHVWQSIIQLRVNLDLMLFEFILPESQNLQDNPIDVDRKFFVRIFS